MRQIVVTLGLTLMTMLVVATLVMLGEQRVPASVPTTAQYEQNLAATHHLKPAALERKLKHKATMIVFFGYPQSAASRKFSVAIRRYVDETQSVVYYFNLAQLTATQKKHLKLLRFLAKNVRSKDAPVVVLLKDGRVTLRYAGKNIDYRTLLTVGHAISAK